MNFSAEARAAKWQQAAAKLSSHSRQNGTSTTFLPTSRD